MADVRPRVVRAGQREKVSDVSDERSERHGGEATGIQCGRRMKVLIVTPEITYVPREMAGSSPNLSAKAGGLGDVSASLVSALFRDMTMISVWYCPSALSLCRALMRGNAVPGFSTSFSCSVW